MMTKVFVVLTAVLSIAASCLFVSAAAQWADYKTLAERYQAQKNAAVTNQMQALATAEASLAKKDAELAEKGREITELQRKALEQTDEIAAQNSDLARLRSEKMASESSRRRIEEVLAVTTGELKTVQQQYKLVLGEKIELQTRNTRMSDRIVELTANNTILQEEARNNQEKLWAEQQARAELERRIAAVPREDAEAAAAMAPRAVSNITEPILGQIVGVDGRRASLNVGETSGVVAGMRFMVVRGSTFLADLVVDNVRPKECGGKLELVRGEVRPGDQAIPSDE